MKSFKKCKRIINDYSDVGFVRSTNEDFAWSGTNDILDHLLIVSDGVGSYAGSDLAAKVVSRAFIKSFDKKEYLKLDLHKWFNKNILEAKKFLHEHIKSNPFHRNMSTTLVLALVVSGKIHIFWVGDSRAYLLNPNQSLLLTKDHNLLNYLLSINATEEEIKRYANSLSSITNSIDADIHKKQTYDYIELESKKNTFIFLASDGFYNFYKMEDLYNVIVETMYEKKLCKQLVDYAISNGSPDNISFSYLGLIK